MADPADTVAGEAPRAERRGRSAPAAKRARIRSRAAGDAAPGAVSRARTVVELVALVAAPTTLLTALAYYFGWRLTESRAAYFGIDHSTLGFSTQDYLLRSVDALFVPLGVLFVLGLAGVTVHVLVDIALDSGVDVRLVRAAATAAAGVGLGLFALGAVGAIRPLPFSTHYLLVPLSPGLGIAVLAYAVYLLGRLATGARGFQGRLPASAGLALVSLIVVLSVFWTMSVYARALGRGRAERLAATLDRRPGVTVFSKERLHIASPGVAEARLPGGGSDSVYRYTGLRLLIRSGGKYFLLPDRWSRDGGVAIVLPDAAGLRFEFTPGE